MAILNTYFRDFLKEIRPTKKQRDEMKTGHETLRDRLSSYEPLKSILVSDFLQGSYRRWTVIRPAGGTRSDVDIVAVTNLRREAYPNPGDALELFREFMKKYYKGKYRFQGRSIGIDLSYVALDLVITSAPSEADKKALTSAAVRSWDIPEDEDDWRRSVDDWRLNEYWIPKSERGQPWAARQLYSAASKPQWKTDPLWIPDRNAGKWTETHPLAQINWTFKKSKNTNHHYVNVVKAIKWWRRIKHTTPKHPKGYPLEHLIGNGCPDGIASVAEGVVDTLENIRDQYSSDKTPNLPDRGVDKNVLERISDDDFKRFHEQVTQAAKLARRALDEENTAKSANLWRDLFGNKFPKPPSSDSGGGKTSGGAVSGGFSERQAPSVPPRGRFA